MHTPAFNRVWTEVPGKGGTFDKWCWANWLAICQSLKQNPASPILCSHKLKDRNIVPKSNRLLQENTGKYFNMDTGEVLDKISKITGNTSQMDT